MTITSRVKALVLGVLTLVLVGFAYFYYRTFAIDEVLNIEKYKHLKGDYYIICKLSQDKSNKRFMLVDSSGRVLLKTHVLHGIGSGRDKAEIFSNDIKSKCSSEGEYKVGRLQRSPNFGVAYRLHGLNESNSNALKRKILLHPTRHLNSLFRNKKIPNSYGCPAISYIDFMLCSVFVNDNTYLIVE